MSESRCLQAGGIPPDRQRHSKDGLQFVIIYYRIHGNIPVSSKIMAISSIMVGLQWIYISHGPGLIDSPISVLDIHYTEYIQKNKKQIGNVINNLS